MAPLLRSPVARRPSAARAVRKGQPALEVRAAPRPEPRWTFLTNHAHVLIVLSKNPLTVLREVALRVGITERAVQRIIADLERDGFIEREKVGRQNSYRLRLKQPLRHPIEAHRSISDLIDVI
ncbi:MAG: winged helix-turn-helix domain-containing protein [Planctomycetes bacterium]|nr:winged helix-turn-helix domain-containing protein [Planctomycetota bacterium]